jgi:hypothetical protein
MPINGIETAYKDRYTFAPPSKRQIKAGSVVHFASAIYIAVEQFGAAHGNTAAGSLSDGLITGIF